MATPPKVDGRNSLFALKEARRYTNETASHVLNASREVARMQEMPGRPDYTRLRTILVELALSVSATRSNHDELWALRAATATPVNEVLLQELEMLKADMERMESRLSREEEPLFPVKAQPMTLFPGEGE